MHFKVNKGAFARPKPQSQPQPRHGRWWLLIRGTAVCTCTVLICGTATDLLVGCESACWLLIRESLPSVRMAHVQTAVQGGGEGRRLPHVAEIELP